MITNLSVQQLRQAASIKELPFNNPTMITSLSVQQLRQAASIKEQIEKLNKELGAILGSTGISATTKPAKPVKKGGMSAAARAKISAAAKARWAKIRAAKPVVKAAVKPAKKKISAAGIARIIAAQKTRWAAIKAKAAPKAAPKAAVVAKRAAKVAAKPIQKAMVAKPAKPAKKFTMSAAAKAKISAAAKARWAKIKAAKKK
jgi:hypothetical protein